MKKLASSLIVILGLSFISITSFASEQKNISNPNNNNNQNPWEVFKNVVHTYKTSNVDFIYKSKAEQEAFLEAADKMKQKISEHSNEHQTEKIQKINQAITIFTYLWEIKDDIQSENATYELIEIPEVI